MHRELAIAGAAAALAACGNGVGPDASEGAAPIAGLYEVTGKTVTSRTGDERAVAGKILIALRGEDGYLATFNLRTIYPSPEGALPADVIGKGEGRIQDRVLTGTAETQLVMATVPDVDPGFAFVPRRVSTRILSRSTATIGADGSLAFEIENGGAPGDDTGSRTTLTGTRVADPDPIRDVAAPPRGN